MEKTIQELVTTVQDLKNRLSTIEHNNAKMNPVLPPVLNANQMMNTQMLNNQMLNNQMWNNNMGTMGTMGTMGVGTNMGNMICDMNNLGNLNMNSTLSWL